MKRFAATASPNDGAYTVVAVNDQYLSLLSIITISIVERDVVSWSYIGHNV